MIDIGWLCNFAIQTVYWLILLACNLLGYSPVWAKMGLKRRQQEESLKLPLKYPSHLAVSFSDRIVDKGELLSLFDCCLASGVRRLSLFDPWNDCISLHKELIIICSSKGIELLDFNNAKEALTHLSSTRLSVLILPAHSGRDSLVDVCKKLSSSSEPVTIQSINEVMSEKFMLGEPELLIQVGQTPTLAGYQPWLLRITEFVQCVRLPCSRHSFEDCLASFSKRDIRVGK